MAVPYTFGTATASIPLSQLDSNFATVITLGNTAIQLGNTVTTLNNMTLANVTISSGNVTLTNVTITTANVTTANVVTLIVTGNETVQGNTTVTGTITGAKLIPTGSSVTGNGLYLPAANSVGISTNGTNAVYIDSTQKVGIGAISSGATLAVTGTLSATGLISTSSASGQMSITSSTGTNTVNLKQVNTGGTYYFGVEDSVGGSFGATAYDAIIYAPATRAITNVINLVPITRTTSTGLAVTGTLSATGAVTSAASFGSIAAGGTGANAYFIDNNTGTGANPVRIRSLGSDASTVGGVIIQGAKSDNSTITALATFSGTGVTTLSGTLNGGTSGTGYSFSGSAPAGSLALDSSGNLGIGTTSPSVASGLGIVVNGGAGQPRIALKNTNTGDASGDGFQLAVDTSSNAYIDQRENAALIFNTNNSERARIDSSGNVLVTNPAGLGYGTGSGGTVTQATSKSTAVTLNKPTGQITMNAAALLSATTVYFDVNDSLVAATDNVLLTLSNFSALNYTIKCFVTTGKFTVVLKNETAGSLSDAVVFNFGILKGATS